MVAYVTTDEVKDILDDNLLTYPSALTSQIEFAETWIDSRLSGYYSLRFDDTALYASVPKQIKWIAAYLVAHKLWDEAVPLEGQSSDTAAQRWWDKADAWLTCLRSGDCALTFADGTSVDLSGGGGGPRFYPDADADIDRYFTRADAFEW